MIVGSNEISTTLAASNDEQPAPRHVAIIMDGNGRWAKARNLPRSAGHKKGSEAVKEAATGAIKAGVEFLTIYAFSTENWNRPEDEVQDLMGLLRYYLRREIKQLHKEDVRLSVLGDKNKLASDIVELIEEAEQLTSENKRLTLIIALNYGSRSEIVEATRKIASAVKNGSISEEDISIDSFSEALSTRQFPDPDLVVRTSGEQRLSNFLLWQVAYSELYFTNVLWPDFREQDFFDAVKEYQKRSRRFGARSS